MDVSIFMNKAESPDNSKLSEALGDLYKVWTDIRNHVFEAYPQAIEEWNFPGQKYGWSFRIKDKKRAIIYLLPREGYFLAALVFGEKAVKDALGSEISNTIKSMIESARVYTEGRGFRIEVKSDTDVEDIKKLVDIKLLY